MSKQLRELWKTRDEIAPMYGQAFALCPCEECAVVLVERMALADELIAKTIVIERNHHYALATALAVAANLERFDFWHQLGAIDSTEPVPPDVIEVSRWYDAWHKRWCDLPRPLTNGPQVFGLAFELCEYQSKNLLRRVRALPRKTIFELVLSMHRAQLADDQRKDQPPQ